MKSLDDIPYELVAVVEGAIKQKSLLQKLVNTFSYQEQLTFQSNLKMLAQYLVNYIHIPPQYGDSLNLFMTDKNLPIEFTLKPLRLSQLIDFLKDWLNHFLHETSYERKTHKISFRNILFNTVLLEQKQLIDDYFLTISQKNMLISDDIFNLLQEILSHYYLYEHKQDSLAFFDKQNVIESFKRIVSSYLSSQIRLQCASIIQDKNYIRRDQLQGFIKFWQDSSQELLLCVDKRMSICESGSQTDSSKTYNVQVQTDYQNDTILHLINSTLTKLNSCSQQETHGQAIQRIRSFLLTQKISLLRKKEQQVEKYRQPPQTQKYKLTASKTFFPQTPTLNLSLCMTPKKEVQKLQLQTNQKQGLSKPLQRKIESSLLSSKTKYRFANK